MKQRGRKSAAALSVIQQNGVTEIRRPDPPTELSDEQAHEWRSVVNRLPAEWFPRETHGMLAQYCRHVVMSRRVSQLIESAESKDQLDLDEYDQLGKMLERESRIIASLATKMRISQQSTLDREKRKPSQGTPKPWD